MGSTEELTGPGKNCSRARGPEKDWGARKGVLCTGVQGRNGGMEGGPGKDWDWGEGVPGRTDREEAQGRTQWDKVPRATLGLAGEWSLDNTGDRVRVRSSQ